MDGDKPNSYSATPSNDSVFQRGTNSFATACLNFTANRWDLYAHGYKKAAEVLVDEVMETHRSMDVLIYPIAFLYRHYLELRIKELLLAGRALLDEPPNLEHVYRLDLLWISCRRILEQIWPQSHTAELDRVTECVSQFCEADPLSTSFRYPVTKDGKLTIPSLQHIDILHLHEVMDRISELLDAASMGIASYLQQK